MPDSMAENFVNNVNSLCTAGLLAELESTQILLERLSTSSPESETIDLLEQVKDLVDVTLSLDGLVTSERRDPSLNIQLLSAGDLVHLHCVCSRAAAVTQECTRLLETLRESLKEISHARYQSGYVTNESRLRNQAWYDETCSALKLRTGVLRMVFSAIKLLYHKNETDKDGNLSTMARFSASTTRYQIKLVEPQLRAADERRVFELHKALDVVRSLALYVPVSTNKHFNIRLPKPFYTGRENLPWLLIIDNVDAEEIYLDELLPPGPRGSIIITSRNPACKSYGTVGERYLELSPMDKEEANELVLKVAEEPSPYSKTVKGYAATICQALDFLPLALVHAAKPILGGLCGWEGYLNLYDFHIKRIRRVYHRRDRSRSDIRPLFDKEDNNMNVFSTYEILYHSIIRPEEKFQDAVELLHVFSYSHFQNIRLDFLINAALNLYKEEQQRESEQREEQAGFQGVLKPVRKPLTMLLREASFSLKRNYFWTPITLPAVLKKPEALSQRAFAGEVRLRLGEALGVLIERSLIIRHDRLDIRRYSMHPLVHRWIRKRPQISTSQQSLWCQVAATILARSVVIPPLVDTESERQRRRELVSHVIHVRDCQTDIKKNLEEDRPRKSGYRPMNRYLRFSRVYSQCGQYDEALELQSRTLHWVVQQLGEDHQLSIRLTIVLSGTLFALTRITEATKLQRRSRKLCSDSLGEDHPLTLEVAETLGLLLYHKGRYIRYDNGPSTKASLKQLSESHDHVNFVLKQRRETLGKEHPLTLLAIMHLARLKSSLGDHVEAERIVRESMPVAERNLGKDHIGVMAARTHYANILMEMERYEEAENILNHVIEKERYKMFSDEDGDHPGPHLCHVVQGCIPREAGQVRRGIELV
ncbi:hypothetical protein AAE478_009951 [Parahypoxylon ruwenzoriense]